MLTKCSYLFTGVLALGAFAAATGQKYPAPPASFFEANGIGRSSIIHPGDVLSVRFHFNPELNKLVTVRGDGKVSLDFFQGIQAAGSSPEDFQVKLVDLYSKEYTRPEITVDVERAANETVYVTGEVLLPGAKELHGNITLSMVLAMAQVNQKTAATKSVFLIRNSDKNTYTVYKMDGSFPNGSSRGLVISPGDVVFVPRKKIVQADDLMEQYVRQLLPAAPNVSASVLFTPGVTNAVTSVATTH